MVYVSSQLTWKAQCVSCSLDAYGQHLMLCSPSLCPIWRRYNQDAGWVCSPSLLLLLTAWGPGWGSEVLPNSSKEVQMGEHECPLPTRESELPRPDAGLLDPYWPLVLLMVTLSTVQSGDRNSETGLITRGPGQHHKHGRVMRLGSTVASLNDNKRSYKYFWIYKYNVYDPWCPRMFYLYCKLVVFSAICCHNLKWRARHSSTHC